MAKKKTKYSDVITHLPKYPTIEPERFDVVRVVQERIRAAPPRGINGKPTDEDMIEAYQEVVHKYCEDIYNLLEATTEGRLEPAELAKTYATVRKVIDTLGREQFKLGIILEAYQGLMIDSFQTAGIQGMKLSNGQPVSTYEEPYTKVIDKEKFRLWCIKQGLEKSMTLHSSTTASLCKERLLAGEEEPPGIEMSAKTKVRLGSE